MCYLSYKLLYTETIHKRLCRQSKSLFLVAVVLLRLHAEGVSTIITLIDTRYYINAFRPHAFT
nr:MAG TPA: hypothetical protein [Caudoviricetes sp.]